MTDKHSALVAMLEADKRGDADNSRIAISPGLSGWLLEHKLSLALTSYQSGRFILAGVAPDGRVAFNEQRYARATGLCADQGRLFVASMFQIWRLENILDPGQFANNAHDAVFIPREARTVNYIDVHEMGVDRDARLIFVNSRYSCLATFDDRHSFQAIWKPRFISALAPEDRCHLNGLAMENGAPRFVSAVSTTDTKDGWRDSRRSGGVLIDVASNEIVTDRLSMPHSPRLYRDRLWALDSGRGWLVQVDPRDGSLTDVAFCPGFLRGLTFHGDFAIVTTSRSREESFGILALEDELAAHGTAAVCSVSIVDLRSGQIVQSITFEGDISELFDVVALPAIRNPMSIGPGTVDMIGAVSLDAGNSAKI